MTNYLEALRSEDAQTPRERAEATKRFISMSGPEYLDIEVKIIRHNEGNSAVEWVNIKDDDRSSYLNQRQVSYASWYMLRAAEIGEVVTVKIRSDDAGLRL